MKYLSLQLNLLVFLFIFNSCKKSIENSSDAGKSTVDSITIAEKENSKRDDEVHTNKAHEENENDEYISKSLFESWQGIYQLRQEDQIDNWGRESTSFSELVLVKPDSCIFKSWLADSDGKRYKQHDNYQEFIGGILATSNKDSIEFYTKKVVVGGNSSLSPLLTVTRNQKKYFLYSVITSPPNNGIIQVPIEKKE